MEASLVGVLSHLPPDRSNRPDGDVCRFEFLFKLVNANHEVFPGQAKTVTFTVPKGASHSQFH